MIDFIGNNAKKDTLYENEIPYRTVCNMVKMCCPNQYKMELYKYGLTLIKPEAIIMGKAYEIFTILHAAGFELIYLVHKNLDATCVSEMWQIFLAKFQFGHILLN